MKTLCLDICYNKRRGSDESRFTRHYTPARRNPQPPYEKDERDERGERMVLTSALSRARVLNITVDKTCPPMNQSS